MTTHGTFIRGCGVRIAGALYHTLDRDSHGTPFQRFIVDPPVPGKPSELAPQGVAILRRVGLLSEPMLVDGQEVWDIHDWVGESHYPNAADFVEEVKRAGLSRRIPLTIEFEKLSRHSRHFLYHSHAVAHDPAPYYADRQKEQCVRDYQTHDIPDRTAPFTCASLWWEAVAKGEPVQGRQVKRKMPSFEYDAWAPPQDTKPLSMGLFMAFPLAHFDVVFDPIERAHEKALKELERLGPDLSGRIRTVEA